jgi:general secretion pathway protein D
MLGGEGIAPMELAYPGLIHPAPVVPGQMMPLYEFDSAPAEFTPSDTIPPGATPSDSVLFHSNGMMMEESRVNQPLRADEFPSAGMEIHPVYPPVHIHPMGQQ